jgi:predicted RNase H-like nuclease
VRPGPISDNLRIAAEVNGYPLVTRNPVISGLIEVYPHPALVELTGADRRLPYKHGNRSKYWPTLSGPERIRALLAVWDRIISALEQELDQVAAKLPMPATNASPATLKAFEDMLDAVVCAWVGIKALEGNAIPYGDEHSAIWIPKSGAHR